MGLIEDTPVFLNQHEDEFILLLDLFKKRMPKHILEIGTYCGGTLYHWIKNAPDGAMIFANDDQHINENSYFTWVEPLRRVSLNWYKGDSRSRAAIGFAKVYSPYDFIFIDGDHSYEGVKADWNNYGPMIAKGGIIALHDILPHPPYDNQPIEVNKLWAEIKKEYKTEEIIGSAVWPDQAGIGVVYFD